MPDEPDPNAAALPAPVTVSVGSREFVVVPPTPRDTARVFREMERLAAAKCVPPLAAVAAVPAAALSGTDRVEAIRAAVALSAGGGVKPTREAVVEMYGELDGVRFRLWHAARKADPTLTREAVDEAVTEDTVDEAYEQLELSLGYRALNAKKASGSGTP